MLVRSPQSATFYSLSFLEGSFKESDRVWICLLHEWRLNARTEALVSHILVILSFGRVYQRKRSCVDLSAMF